jgi:multiple antibiotic resistance protein
MAIPVYDPLVDVFSAVVTLFLIMDPLGNIPLFLSVLKTVSPDRRRIVLMREIVFAYLVLLLFLFLGRYILQFLRLDQETISISGGIVLFLIALRMIFPGERSTSADSPEGEPFVVPLAVPLFAGPSVLAALLLMQRSAPGDTRSLWLAVTIAWALSGVILLASTFFYRILRERGLIAVERLMGMLLVMVAVQMLMSGVKIFLAR